SGYRVNVLLLSYVGGNSVGFAATAAYACNSGVQFQFVSRHQYDAGPVGCKLRAQSQPEATAATRDENRSIVNIHFCSSEGAVIAGVNDSADYDLTVVAGFSRRSGPGKCRSYPHPNEG